MASDSTNAWTRLRRLPGTLLAAPAVVLLLGSDWTLEKRVEPSSARLARTGEADATVATYLVPEGATLEQGVVLAPGTALLFELPAALSGPFELELQAFYRDAFWVSASGDGVAFEALWQVPAAGSRGMQTRTRAFAAPETAIRYLQVRPRGKSEGHRFTGLRVTYRAAVIPHWWVVAALWGLALVALGAARWRVTRPVGDRLLEAWSRVDLWVATLLIALVVFRVTPELLWIGAGLGLIALAVGTFVRYFKRAPLATVGYVVFLYVLFFLFLPWAIGKVATARAASLYDFTVDHRMRPDGDEINSDGLRFRGEASDLDDDDFVILQLGDSFTYGLGLAYEASYPYVLEDLLGGLDCTSDVRVVNFGWGSSSPLLSLRLLEQVGERYEPDLVLYNLDMTDFNDDLRYESELRAAGDLEIDQTKVVRAVLLAVSSRLPALGSLEAAARRLLRIGADGETDAGGDVPKDRFFVTARRLEATREDIERGVMKNLARLHELATRELGVPMALVVYPRAYQYSSDESPRNWERHRYQRLGPFVREPFRYFDEVAETLPYPVFSLLPAFESTERFPLFFEDDPHWNAAGARLAAESVARFLESSGWLPCTAG